LSPRRVCLVVWRKYHTGRLDVACSVTSLG